MRTLFLSLALVALCAGCATHSKMLYSGPLAHISSPVAPYSITATAGSPLQEYESHRLYLNDIYAQAGARRLGFLEVGPYLNSSRCTDLGAEWNAMVLRERKWERGWSYKESDEYWQKELESNTAGLGPVLVELVLVLPVIAVTSLSQDIEKSIHHKNVLKKSRGIMERFNSKLASDLGLASVGTSALRGKLPDLKDGPDLAGLWGGSPEDWGRSYHISESTDWGWLAGGKAIPTADIPAYMQAQGAMKEASDFSGQRYGRIISASTAIPSYLAFMVGITVLLVVRPQDSHDSLAYGWAPTLLGGGLAAAASYAYKRLGDELSYTAAHFNHRVDRKILKEGLEE